MACMRAWLTLVILLLAPALAASPRQMLESGGFAAAWQAGSVSNELDDLTAAAEAANLMAQYQVQGKDKKRLWLERAQAAARRAISLYPESAEAYYQLAQAQAEIIRFVGLWSKITLASAVKENLDACLKRDPDHARAHMGLALWHLQLAKRGLGWLYGAATTAVVPLFEQAVELAPSNIEVRKNYGFALIELEKYDAARQQLEQALALPTLTVPDQLHQARARQLLAKMP